MLTVSVHSLKETIFEGEAKSVIIPTSTGQITVLENHIPLISSLNRGKIIIKRLVEKELEFKTESGFLEVKPKSRIIILIQNER